MIARPPLRFLGLVIGAWIVGRVAWLLPPAPRGLPAPAGMLVGTAVAASGPLIAAPLRRFATAPSLRAVVRTAPPARLRESGLGLLTIDPPHRTPALSIDTSERIAFGPLLDREGATPAHLVRADPVAGALRRFGGYAYLHLRPGRGDAATVGPGGQLGASQAGLRVAYALDRRFAVAGRLSVPTGDTGAGEVAAGVDLAVATGARLSVERRVALGPRGRNAWSAYVAGGFYEGFARGLELDGYAQAGVVGVRRRDLFADGAIRGGRRLGLDGGRALVLGAGAWGAAQPGAARLDIGPRAALAFPLGDLAVTLALEGRMRVTGKARPGSGVALTLATDF